MNLYYNNGKISNKKIFISLNSFNEKNPRATKHFELLN